MKLNEKFNKFRIIHYYKTHYGIVIYVPVPMVGKFIGFIAHFWRLVLNVLCIKCVLSVMLSGNELQIFKKRFACGNKIVSKVKSTPK